jgi:cyclic beta-1,2-glucan synthetase
VLLGLTFMAYHAWQSTHAVVLTLVRLMFTRRRLLEWETAAVTAARSAGLVGRRGLRQFAIEMMASPITAASVTLLIIATRPSALLMALPFLLSWAAAPGLGYWLSRPIGARERPLSESDRALFRATARRTWSYFETFVTAEDGWLPPDNYQESPFRVAGGAAHVAHQRGDVPSLLVAAHDLGYLTTPALIERLDRTLTTLESLERHHGHFLNWYDTSTREPLRPQYVSTVDSGNLAAVLVAVTQGARGSGALRPRRSSSGSTASRIRAMCSRR